MSEKRTSLCLNCIFVERLPRNVTLCIIVSLALSACVSPDIYDDPSFNPPVYFGTHVVTEGETLYSIARRYGRDFRELAKANKIESPYAIFPKQRIDLEKRVQVFDSSKQSENRSSSGSRNVTTGNRINVSPSKFTKIKKHKDYKDIEWKWPHLGPILAKFDISAKAVTHNSVNKGIDIGGSKGDAIYAAADGEVAYAGSGLLGYGLLLIINHDDQHLSAYAHNRRLLVQEGQKIKKGQHIAEMGDTGTDRLKLHFEIRRNGQPVDPLRYLPKR